MAAILVATAVGILGAPSGAGAGITTLGNQERQDISAPNHWVEGNIDFWLESHLYDAQVRIDAGSGPAFVPNEFDVAMSFFFAEKNAIVVDWTQDWHVSLNRQVMFWTKNSAPPGAPYTCSDPPDIVDIPVNGRSIRIPQAGSICILDVGTRTTGNPATGWANLMTLPLPMLNRVLPNRNEPCTAVDNGLCQPSAETEQSPAKEHFFRVSLVNLFGPGGLFPQDWWPFLPAGESIAVYFRNHLALTAIWNTAIGGAGGGSQPNFCITTEPGAIRNTNYNRCGWKTVAREGAGSAQGSKNHGYVIAPGIGQKTIPLPQVVAPTGHITVCKKVTSFLTDREGRWGTFTDGWAVHLQGPYETDMTRTTGSDGPGCARFGPIFPAAGYFVSETLLEGYLNIGTVVEPPSDRNGGANPEPANPVNVTLTFSEARWGTGPTVTFVNLLVAPGLAQDCRVEIRDANGELVTTRAYAIAGDTVTFVYNVTNTGNINLMVWQTHSNTARLGLNPIFQGTLARGETHTETRSTLIVKGDEFITDTINATGSVLGRVVYAPEKTCSVECREPNVMFEKHPVEADGAEAVPGAKVTYTILVWNTGDAPAFVSVSDALGTGQTFLNGGADTMPGDVPSPAPSSPAGGADYPAPVTVIWEFSLAAGASVEITFRVLVTTPVDNSVITGLATVLAVNGNGVDYSPDPNSQENFVTVHRPIVKLTAFGYTNRPEGTPNQGVVNGTTVYTVTFTNYGSGVAQLTGSLEVAVTGGAGGTWWCSGDGVVGCLLSFSDVAVAPGDSVTFTLTFEYRDMPTGAVVSAGLSASYITEGSGQTYVPSGVPARIEFTIQGG